MTKAKLTRIPKRVLACVLAVLMVLSCLTMLPFTGFAANENHAKLESPAVVQDGDKYYAFGNDGVVYKSSDMAKWELLYGDENNPAYGYLAEGAFAYIRDNLFGDSGLQQNALDSPEVVNINGKWYLYLSIMDGSRSMIVVGTSENIEGPYNGFQKVLETGFNRGDATDVLQSYFSKSYVGQEMPDAVEQWGKGTCYYYSNFLGLNYQWFTEELPRAYAPSITQYNGEYYMAYGYRNGGIWLQKIDTDTGLVDFTWSGGNWNNGCAGNSAEEKRSSANHYLPEDCYDTDAVDTHRLDPYFGQLIAHTTEGGDTDTLESTVSRAGEEPELYAVGDTLYLQVTYGGADNGDGYNVRSYKHTSEDYTAAAGDVRMLDFKDMNGELGVDNANESMIEADSNRTGLKLMGDYNLPGTPEGEYYTSPGASSVTQGEDGMLFYNYQVKTNFSANGTVKSAEAEMRSHILLHNSENQPLVMPFEYTGAADKDLYEAAIGDANAEYDIDNDIAGQYYVTMTTDETSTAKQGITGLTLTAGHLVAGAFSGSWDFEDITLPDGSTYQNGLVITDENGNEYHGAFLKQSPEDPNTLNAAEGESAPVTFAIVVGNTTYWGVWYDQYIPASENNADAGLSVSPAIYTGGALELNTVNNGELGLKYGNYISVLRFAQNDYSTYLTIDDRYVIDDVIDDDFNNQQDYNSGIQFEEIRPDTYQSIINDAYLNRGYDSVEANSDPDGADQKAYSASTGNKAVADGVDELEKMLEDKYEEAQQNNQHVYILYGWLDSGKYGRNASFAQDEDSRNDKGDITLRVSYYDSTNEGATFTERVYSHVYQQPVSANVSGAVYSRSYYHISTNYMWAQNSIFMRAEGSYSADSYLPGTTEVRNTTMSDKGKYFAAYPTFGYYNDSLFGSNPNYGNQQNGDTYDFFHGNTQWILTEGGLQRRIGFNNDYRPSSRENPNIDIAVSYEQTVNEWDERNNLNYWAYVPGSRAEYYVDISSPTTSNIASYYEEATDSFEIPMYYSNISNDNDYQDYSKRFNFTDEEINYNAGLYPADDYLPSSSERTGVKLPKFTSDTNYPFQINFDQIDAMYADNGSDQWGMRWDEMSYSANALINVSRDSIKNTASQSYNAEKTDDYNFYVRTRSETVDGVNGGDGHARLVEDLEYGIYVSDKSYVRDYYDSITQGKFATGYTYYSWEAYRDATRLVADYLNNYMDLADATYDSDGEYSPNGKTELDLKDSYDQYLKTKGWTVDTVLANEEGELDTMLSDHSAQVQDVYCYLLNDAVERLFDFEYYNEFNQAYQQYEMLDNYDEYTTSSWQAYQQYRNIQVADGLTLEALAGYDWAAKDDPDSTPDDPNSTEKPIYDPTDPDKENVVNDSWKIINDEFFKRYDMTAREVFAEATALINEAMDVLRHKADYDDLDEQMSVAESYKGSLDIASVLDGSNAGNLGDANMGENATVKGNSDIFSIDRSTVNALANQMKQGTDDNGNSYVEDEEGNRYTISSMAAFDKVYHSIWEQKDNVSHEEADLYLDSVAEPNVNIDERPVGEQNNPDTWYSSKLRDDQQYFTNDRISGEDTEHLSTVQQKIVDKTTQMQMVLNYLKANKMSESLEDQYQTFDYLIDVISTIDFNAYTEAGQELLWNKLYELLVQGGVYLVNQQLFDPSSLMEGAAIDEDSPLYEVLYGDNDQTYYTGWNAANVDAATTELMELLTTLDTAVGSDGETPLYKKNFDINVNVSVYNEDGTPYITPTISDTIHYAYGDPVTVDVTKYTEQLGSQYATYDPAHMYIHSWSIESSSGTQYLHNTGNVLEFTASEAATVNVAVSLMPTPSDEVPENTVNVTVNSMIAHADRVDLAMNLSESELRNYKITVADDDTLTITGPNSFSKTFTPYKVSFYEFAGWRYNGLYDLFQVGQEYCLADYVKDGKVTISPYYKVQGLDVEITVNGKAVDNLQYRKFDSLVEFGASEFDTDLDGKFAAWLLKDTDASGEWDGTYTIASYDQEFSFYASDDEAYVQANKVTAEDGSFYYVVSGDEAKYDENSQYNPAGESEDAIKEIDTKSLYYRLSNGLRDAWSHISEYDPESETVSLYSHFTSSETVPENAKVIETGGLFVYVNGDPSSKLDVFDDRLVVGANGINQFIATQNSSSGQSEGQYVVSVVIPDERQDNGLYALMRNYVRYSYELEDPTTGEKKTFYSYAYSDLQYTPVG